MNNDNSIQIVFRNYGKPVKRNADSNVQEIYITLYKAQSTEDSVADEPDAEKSVSLSRFGLYSIMVKCKSSRVKLVNTAADNMIIIDSAVDKLHSDEEYLPSFQRGFLFYKSEYNETTFRLETDEGSYESAPIKIISDDEEFYDVNNQSSLFSEDNTADMQGSTELMDMFLRIYEYQPVLMYSVFRKTPAEAFIGADSNIRNVMDLKLKQIENSMEIYRSKYKEIRRVIKYNLKSFQYVDRIDKLSCLSSDTIRFMAQNPQYLIEVKKKKGISHNGKVYLPERTLVSRNIKNYDIYENRYILSFLKMMQTECMKLKLQLELSIAYAEYEEKNISNNPKYRRADFGALGRIYQINLDKLKTIEPELRKYYRMYSAAFDMEQEKNIPSIVNRPKATAIFRQIPEYNILFNKVYIPWFEHGLRIDDDEAGKSTFEIALSNPSTTYELYIITEWMNLFAGAGFTLDKQRVKFAGVHEKLSRYSDDAYEFVFVRGDEELTVYYSPSVYLPVVDKETGNVKTDKRSVDNILFRNTKSSIVSREDNESNGKGAHYEPDFIIKYQKEKTIRYIIADAKHKDFKTVNDMDMPDLIYKYIESIRVLNRQFIEGKEDWDIKISGMAAIYHLHSGDEDEKDIYQEYESFSDEEEQFKKLLFMNVNDSAVTDSWVEPFKEMMHSIGCELGDN